MGLFKKLRKKWEKWYYHDLDDDSGWEEEDYYGEEEYLNEDEYDSFHDADTRTVMVLENLGRMKEAADRAEQSREEYDAITALLVDMEEIDALPNEEKVQIVDQAMHIEKLERERQRLFNESGGMDEEQIKLFKRYEDDIPGGIKKIREAEDYRRLIRMDMRKMEAERNSYRFQLKEAVMAVTNSRGAAIICAVSMAIALVLLAVLQGVYKLDVSLGYILIGGAGALTLTVLFVKYQDAAKEIKHLEKLRNRMIGLHNTVKIRYVNNTNLLSYLYMKYDTDSADKLEEDWARYVEIMNARYKDEKIRADLEYYYNKLNDCLSRNGIKDPDIWNRQVRALTDPREMVEIRHALLSRRQKLRENMEYNKEVAEKSQKLIKDLASAYPEYSEEIAGIVARYDGN
ncbi:MAG: hypothetical protein IKI75_04170 [Lachnospiraceae bacterium]|nr:hypothetical protein [Lachnospiraceae bacterium]